MVWPAPGGPVPDSALLDRSDGGFFFFVQHVYAAWIISSFDAIDDWEKKKKKRKGKEEEEEETKREQRGE